jgi:hypothetical protein
VGASGVWMNITFVTDFSIPGKEVDFWKEFSQSHDKNSTPVKDFPDPRAGLVPLKKIPPVSGLELNLYCGFPGPTTGIVIP